MKVGARNQLIGEVTEVRRGTVMAEVKLTIPAGSPMASVLTLESLDELGIQKGDKVRVVVNRYGQPKEVPAGKAVEALGVAIDFYLPEDSKTVNRANNNGIPVVTESPSARVSKSLTNLAVSVNGRHSHPGSPH